MKEASATSVEGITSDGIPTVKGLEKVLERWIKLHRPTIQVSAIQALTLQLTPERCATDILYITLIPNPAYFNNPNLTSKSKTTDTSIAKAFLLDHTSIIPGDATLEVARERFGDDSANVQIIAATLDRSKEHLASGGGGFVLVVTFVESIMHLTPFGLEEKVTPEDVPLNADWESQFKVTIESGTLF